MYVPKSLNDVLQRNLNLPSQLYRQFHDMLKQYWTTGMATENWSLSLLKKKYWTTTTTTDPSVEELLKVKEADELVQLARRCRFTDARVATLLLRTIYHNVPMEKVVEAVVSDRKWLQKLLSHTDEGVLGITYHILEKITDGKYDQRLWDVLLEDIIPAILKKFVEGDYTDVMMWTGIMVISNAINGAGSLDEDIEDPDDVLEDKVLRIRELLDVLDDKASLIRVLLHNVWLFIDPLMETLENIMRAGVYDSKENKYAAMISECLTNMRYDYFCYEAVTYFDRYVLGQDRPCLLLYSLLKN